MGKDSGRMRVLADMATLGMAGEARKARRYRVVGAVAPSAETQHANKQELKRQRKQKAKPTLNEQAMAKHTRDRPTKERMAQGVFEHADLARFDTKREGDKALLDWKARAGGVGEMYLRGQITRRMADAAAQLMEHYELAQSSGLSCSEVRERVDGGKLDLTGGRLQAASFAWGDYQGALAKLSRWGRYLVENRVVQCRPMSEIVVEPVMADAVGGGEIKLKCKLATAMLRDALDQLADHFHLPAS